MQKLNAHGGSFRDPLGVLLEWDGRIFRNLSADGKRQVNTTLQSSVIQKFTKESRWIETHPVEPREEEAILNISSLPSVGLVEHPRIFFPSYPFEWSSEMLFEAGSLTLDLAEQLLDEGLGLKDASAWNILFDGSQAKFVDILSVERREPLDPRWAAFGQFARHFLNPLLAAKYFAVQSDSVFLRSSDGLGPEDVYRMASWLRRLSPTFFPMITVPTWIGHWANRFSTSVSKTGSDKEARLILRTLFGHLRRMMGRAKPALVRSSSWSGYHASEVSYVDYQKATKARFTKKFLEHAKPKQLLDVGCNSGHYSLLAAGSGAKVVAVDSDPVVVGQLWRRANAMKLDILPLHLDICSPSPALGWRNQQAASFIARSTGRFDAVFALAVMHHMISRHQVPMSQILGFFSELSTRDVIFEFIGPEDPLFKQMTWGRDHLRLTRESFEKCVAEKFDTVESVQIPQADRFLYHLRKKTP